MHTTTAAAVTTVTADSTELYEHKFRIRLHPATIRLVLGSLSIDRPLNPGPPGHPLHLEPEYIQASGEGCDRDQFPDRND
jgi:hypothetical protein